MKKYLFVLMALTIPFFSCNKDNDDDDDDKTTNNGSLFDKTAPVIVLNESNNYTVFGTPYEDPGATVIDNLDEEPTIAATGEIDENYAGEQTIVYTARDASGNTSVSERNVTVDAAPYVANSSGWTTFTVDDTDPDVPVYIESVAVSNSTYNRIYFSKFAWFENATVYAELFGNNTVSIPEQIVNCGNDNVDRKFVGSGTFTQNNLIITYHVEDDNGMAFSGTATYTKQ